MAVGWVGGSWGPECQIRGQVQRLTQQRSVHGRCWVTTCCGLPCRRC